MEQVGAHTGSSVSDVDSLDDRVRKCGSRGQCGRAEWKPGARHCCDAAVRPAGSERSQSFVPHMLFLQVVAMVTQALLTTEAQEGFFRHSCE